ncbi:hypothetical protein FACS1894110_01950 [Spirochaetia bacterium]|nr:hypothetical protein FACS1894110_01950 [Spirochaetia bacterium]
MPNLLEVMPQVGMRISYRHYTSMTILEVIEHPDEDMRIFVRNDEDGYREILFPNGDMEIIECSNCIRALDFTFMVPCDDCGELTYKDELTKCQNNNTVCGNCREEKYFQCYHCGEWYSKDDVHLFDERNICDDCFAEHYTTCTHCDNTIESDTAISNNNGDMYCLHCYDEVYIDCENCGREINREDARYDEGRGQYFCWSCFEENPDDADLHSHGSDLRVCFHDERASAHYDSIDRRMYYGMELELETPSGKRGEVVDAILDESENDWYLEEDGSLRDGRGIEVIAHARTFKSWTKFWDEYDERVLQVATRKHCMAHDAGTCGIHIHTSLDAWEGDQLFRLFSLVYDSHNYDNILIISQRDSDKLAQWSSLNIRDIGYCKTNIENKKTPFADRFAALNITGYTLEFRLFNSNLRLDRVQKNMEFVHALYCYTKQLKRQASWKGLMSWVTRHKGMVSHLYAFLVEKGILEEKKAEVQEAA